LAGHFVEITILCEAGAIFERIGSKARYGYALSEAIETGGLSMREEAMLCTYLYRHGVD
jgi:hypothetical protein